MSEYSKIVDANPMIGAAGKRIAQAMLDSSVDGRELVYAKLREWNMANDTAVQSALETAVAAEWAALIRERVSA
jgi:hypothetical protein